MLIIAEVGSNWKTFEEIKDSIALCKSTGANAVKFQLFTPQELYGPYIKKDMSGVMPRDWVKNLALKAKASKIEFMCSAFSPEGYKFVDPFVKRHKVASSEMNHLEILHTLNELKKPVILSCGASKTQEIYQALDILKEVPVTLLYCVSSYPAHCVDLRVIELMQRKFGTNVGYSDHTKDITNIPKMAMIMGASVIEKHINTTNHTDTPDAPHSLTVAEFKMMVQSIKGKLPAPIICANSEEQDMITTHKRRVIAARDIRTGETLKYGENYGFFRSLVKDDHAYGPHSFNSIEGKLAKRPIKQGFGIGPGDF